MARRELKKYFYMESSWLKQKDASAGFCAIVERATVWRTESKQLIQTDQARKHATNIESSGTHKKPGFDEYSFQYQLY